MMQRTLLLVDDEENITFSLKRLLRRDGYNIFLANSGQDGLALLEKNTIGVIISDQRMPGMMGTEFLTKVKTLYPDTIRIVLSGYTELSSITDAINRGAVYKFLTKPWEDDLLRANVEEAFQRYEMKIENARLAHELQLANEELRKINQALTQRVEFKIRESQRHENLLRVSQEVLEHLPVVIVGIGDDGLIVIANQLAHRLFSPDRTLLGESASAFIPEQMLAEVPDGNDSAKSFVINGRTVMSWCRQMGEDSHSSGVLLVISADF